MPIFLVSILKSEMNIKGCIILLLINASISWKHISVGQIKLPMCLIVFMGIYLVPFIRQRYSLPLLGFSDCQGECFKHLHHLCFLLLQAINKAIVENSIFIDSILYQQA